MTSFRSSAAIRTSAQVTPWIVTPNIPAAAVNVAYTTTLTANGGAPPYAWAATGLPSGMLLNGSTGVLSGTPLTAGATTFTVTVTDSASQASQPKAFTLTVTASAPVVTVTTTSLPAGTVGTAYSATLAASGGTSPYTWSSTGMPAGLTLSTGGVISGTPTTAASSTISVTAQDATSVASAVTNLTLVVNAVQTGTIVVTPSLQDAYVGSFYAAILNAVGGTAPYTWTVTGAPSWMSVNTGTWATGGGTVTGTPTATGTVVLACQATDGATPANVSAVVNVSIAVKAVPGQRWFGAQLPNPPLSFTTTSSPPAPASTNRGSYYTPGVGADASITLQTALNTAAAATGTLGDVIVLQAGTTYTTASSFTLPVRAGSGWIYVIGNQAPEIGGSGLPAAGTRVVRATIPHMPALRTSATGPAVVSRANGAGVAYYRLVGLDIELLDGQGQSSYGIQFNMGDTSASTFCQHITLDRCYLAGAPTDGIRHMVGFDGNYMEATECCVERSYTTAGADNQAFLMLNSTGPYKITNCYLEVGGQVIMPGGGGIGLPGPAMPSDITFTNNHTRKPNFSAVGSLTSGSNVLTITSVTTGEIVPTVNVYSAGGGFAGFVSTPSAAGPVITKQLTGTFGQAGTYQLNGNATANTTADTITGYIWYNGKNNLEFKVGQRVLIDSNFFENAFAGGQSRTALVITARNQGGGSIPNPWYVTSDFTITNNVFANCYNGGVQFQFCDSTVTGANPSQPGFRFLVRNNMFLMSRSSWSGTAGTLDSGTVPATFWSYLGPSGPASGYGGDCIWDHNTIVGPNNLPSALWGNFWVGANASTNSQLSSMVWSNNIWDGAYYGLNAKGGSPGYNFSTHVVPQVATLAFVNNALVGSTDSTIPTGNFKPANAAAVGFTSYGSVTAATGYALTTGSTYHAQGVSGAGLANTAAGTPDGTDLGANISTLPTS